MAWSKQTFIDPPTVSEILALIIFVMNIFLPGVGTIIVGLLACSCEIFIVGILQTITAGLIIGWVWSIWWGWELLLVSRRRSLPTDTNVGRDGLL
ncbi:unnamed protein product [Ascophyllum nodosum]